MIFFVTGCEISDDRSIEIEPYDTEASCPRSASRITDVSFKIVSQSGSSSHADNCTVGTIIKLEPDIFGWSPDYVGSTYLTCTENGWFPLKPKRQSSQDGKHNNIHFLTCIILSSSRIHIMAVLNKAQCDQNP